jgi:hypothetical protein
MEKLHVDVPVAGIVLFEYFQKFGTTASWRRIASIA